jgi:predicted amino acid dehydrogenase
MDVADALGRTIDRLAARSTGEFYRAIVRRRPSDSDAAPSEPIVVAPRPAVVPKPAVSRAGAAPRFAFLVHPLNEHGYADYDTSLAALDAHELREFAGTMAGLLDPVVGTSVEITSPTGARACGDFILIGHTAAQLKDLPMADALKALGKGIDLARDRGAAIVGLGAYTSVVSGGGTHLVRDGMALTSGNTYTVVSTLEALDLALARTGARWSDKTAGVVGAAGAIGSCVAMLLAERAPRLVLVGNPAHAPAVGRARLLGVARAIVRHAVAAPPEDRLPGSLAGRIAAQAAGCETHVDAIVQALERRGELILAGGVHGAALADVVVTATSFPGRSLDDDVLPRGALVCDISRPRSVAESIVQRRPDVRVIDGGLVALPGGTRIGPYGLRDGTSYACMAETMLLALERDFRNTSLGASLDVREVKRQRALARTHGFSIAGLQSFGRPLFDEAPDPSADRRGAERLQ